MLTPLERKGVTMLFGHLNPDIFTLFSGSNRRLYEAVLLKIYEYFFRADLLFPTPTEVTAVIYESLSAHAELWRDEETPLALDELRAPTGRRLRRRRDHHADPDATNEAFGRARLIYTRLIQTGWLEESHYGLKITVDMPSGAMRLAEFLCSLREGMSEQLGGLIIEVKLALESIRFNPRENAMGLNKAARDATAFGRYLRSTLSALRDIDRQAMSSESIEQRLKFYFEDFIEKVLLRDYATITTTSHPYRFRHHILSTLEELEDSEVDLATLAGAYLEARIGQTSEQSRAAVFEDLLKIRMVFDHIESAFLSIQQHRSRLETRLRNTVRYAGRRGGSYLQRSAPLLLRLDHLLASGDGTTTLESVLETRQDPISPFLLARPRGSRTPVTSTTLDIRGHDPLSKLRQRLEREYIDRLTVTPAQASRFLERRVPPFGEAQAAGFWLDDIDDFLAFEAIRLITAANEPDHEFHPLARHLVKNFEFNRAAVADIDNTWLACRGFSVRRKNDRVTLDAANAQ